MMEKVTLRSQSNISRHLSINKNMKISFILTMLFFLTSCWNLDLSEEIKKSQIRFFKKKGLKGKYVLYQMEVFNLNRKRAFEELKNKQKYYADNSTIQLVEAYDVANAYIYVVLIIDEKEFYYMGTILADDFKILDKSPIDRKMIKAYKKGDYNELENPLRDSSLFYVGTTITFKEKLKISHFSWQ